MPHGNSAVPQLNLPPVAAGSELLITSIRTGNTQVFAVDLIFGDMRNLTRHPQSENRYPIWSPDGSKVVFTSDRDVPQTWNLYLMDSDGQNVRRITDIAKQGICYFPTWTRDLIYFGYASGDGKEAVIASVRPDGSDYRIIGPGRDPAVSPDGNTIAFTQHTGQGYCVFTMNADGSHIRQLTTHENRIGAVTPAWSPDGRKLLYSDEVVEKLELFICDADGSNQTQLTHLEQFSASSAWSPDMRFITFRLTDYDYWNYADSKEYVYREKKADKRPVWIMESDGSNPRVIEALHYHCALDGSRPVWRPQPVSMRTAP
jgi:TolB protein